MTPTFSKEWKRNEADHKVPLNVEHASRFVADRVERARAEVQAMARVNLSVSIKE